MDENDSIQLFEDKYDFDLQKILVEKTIAKASCLLKCFV